MSQQTEGWVVPPDWQRILELVDMIEELKKLGGWNEPGYRLGHPLAPWTIRLSGGSEAPKTPVLQGMERLQR